MVNFDNYYFLFAQNEMKNLIPDFNPVLDTLEQGTGDDADDGV